MMKNIKKILVPFDNNLRSIAALDYAAMFATGIEANITALHLADPQDYHSIREFNNKISDLVNDELRPKLKEIQSNYPDIKKIDLQIRGLHKPIHRHIIDFALENKIDFIILRSHGMPGEENWEDTFKSTTAYKVVLEATCPVFTFTKMPERPKIDHILVPLDLSEGSLHKVPFAITLAKQFDATLHLLSASEQEEDLEELKEQLFELDEEIKHKNVNVENTVNKNALPQAIDSYTKKHSIDLIIIMNRPGFRWSDLWISPKAKRIISHSKVPVISLRSNKPVEI
jgi:nucleotide-binding universal stress UspA family protein